MIVKPQIPIVKVEAYNGLCDWTSFGGIELVTSNDDTEMEKAVKYNDIINNSIMLQNVIDMGEIINQLIQEGMVITKKDIAGLSPYIVGHLKRFGDYVIDLDGVPNKIGRNCDLALW